MEAFLSIQEKSKRSEDFIQFDYIKYFKLLYFEKLYHIQRQVNDKAK